MKITHIGGPTAVLNLGGLTFLTDPAFDEPRDYQLPGRVMTKLTGPAIPAADLGPIDVVLLSHDEHKDNLDDSGRALLPSVPTVLSTPGAALRIEGVRGLENWEAIELPRRVESSVRHDRGNGTRVCDVDQRIGPQHNEIRGLAHGDRAHVVQRA